MVQITMNKFKYHNMIIEVNTLEERTKLLHEAIEYGSYIWFNGEGIEIFPNRDVQMM